MADFSSPTGAEEAQGRKRQMLRTAFGPTIAAALADPAVLEVMLNPDGRLWIDSAVEGRKDSGERIGASEAERIIRLVAAHVRREVSTKRRSSPPSCPRPASASRASSRRWRRRRAFPSASRPT